MNNNDEDETSGEGGAVKARLRWLGAALVLLMLGGLVWQAMEAGRSSVPAEIEALVEELADPERIKRLASMDEEQLSRQGASSVAALHFAPPSAGPASDEVEVCGLGRVKADEAGRPRDMAPIQRAAQRLREQVLSTLLKSSDDTARAAGLLMVALDDSRRPDGLDGGAERARDELASLAAFKGSPQVYAWALRACQQQRGEGVCRMLSAEQWARLEPANAMAWLQVAADAKARRDEAAVAEAMYRVSQAPKSDARQGALAEAVLAKLPPEADLLSRIGLAASLNRLDAQAELPLVAASQHCNTDDVHDANRQQVCAAVANLLVKRGSTQAEAALGASIGERTGWSIERAAAAAEERDALAQMTAAADQSADAWTCGALAQTLLRHHEIARLGELATLRGQLKRSPDSAAVLARRYRDGAALRVASAASAASAPSP